MMSITLSAEQFRSAPPEVRRWLEAEIAATMKALRPATAEPEIDTGTLAACGPQEAARLFEALHRDYALTQLFLELGRDGGHATPGGLVAFRAADLMHHARIQDRDQLLAGLAAVERAFHAVRPDAGGALLGIDGSGTVYVHETTCRSIGAVWARLVSAVTQAVSEPDGPGLPFGTVPQKGPSMPVHFGPPGSDGAAPSVR